MIWIQCYLLFVYFVKKEVLKKENLILSKRANARYENLCFDQKIFEGHIMYRKSNGFECNLKKKSARVKLEN